MESREHARAEAQSRASRGRRWLTGLARTALGVALLAALVVWGQIDLHALLELTPSAVVICLALLLVSLPIAALRWAVLLHVVGVSLRFMDLLHFVAIGVLANVLLLGSIGGDAIRGLYAWRALGRSGGRIAVSVLADRLLSLVAVLFIPLAFSLLYWHRMQQVPALAALGTSIIAAAAISMVGAGVLFAVPDLTRPLEARLLRWPRAARLVAELREMILMLRTSPLALLAAFGLALVTQLLAAFAVVAIAQAIKIGALSVADYMFAVPLTLLANALPLTPSGIGVGEAAFDQICRWLEPTPSGAAYSSIFFAFRLVSTLTCIPGLISLAVYRNSARSASTSEVVAGCDKTESERAPALRTRSSTDR
jgi:glycosyltransferase 2 family protein